MSDWRLLRLDELMSNGVISLGRGDVISKDDISTKPGPYPIYSSSAHNDGKFGEYGNYIFDEEMITWSVDGGGNFFYRPKHQYSVTNVCGYMRVKSEVLNCKFAYYALTNQHRFLIFDYMSKAHPSVIKKLYWFPDISLGLQKKIATILTSIDTAIEKTEALIEKYQQIKSGLMHDLFTRGVLPNGQLRPTREQAPELYQETKIGWIPKEWDCGYLKSYLISPPKNGYSPNEIDYWDGIYVLGLGCLTKNGFDPKQLKKVNYKAAISSGAILNDGDVLISRANTPELVGLCGIYKDIGEKVIYPDLMMRISLSSTLDKFYFEQLMLHSSTRNQIKALAVGTSSSMVKLNSTSLKKLIIKAPIPKEQMRIVETIRPFENQLVALTLQLKKLQSQKLGLMQDLLTGKVVPVTVSENADQEEAHV